MVGRKAEERRWSENVVYIYIHVTLVLFGYDALNASLLIGLLGCASINRTRHLAELHPPR